MKNSILIIGNGYSAINSKLGDYIDQYEIVARINNYKTKGYEKLIGSKTDIWINGANSKLIKREKLPKDILVLLPSSIIIKKNKDNNLRKYVKRRLKVQRNNFKILPLDEIQEFEKIINHNRLTTGLYAILWGLKNFTNITIHGFDFFINSKSHYYDTKITNFINKYIIDKGKKHNNKLELKYVKKMIFEKKIKKLTDIYDK